MTQPPRKYFTIDGKPCSKSEYYNYHYARSRIRASMDLNSLDTDYIGADTVDEVLDRKMETIHHMETRPHIKLRHTRDERLSKRQLERIQAHNNGDIKHAGGGSWENEIDDQIKLNRREALSKGRRGKITGSW